MRRALAPIFVSEPAVGQNRVRTARLLGKPVHRIRIARVIQALLSVGRLHTEARQRMPRVGERKAKRADPRRIPRLYEVKIKMLRARQMRHERRHVRRLFGKINGNAKLRAELPLAFFKLNRRRQH